MNDNLAYVEIEETQREEVLGIQEDQDIETQEAVVPVGIRHVDVLWLKKGNLQTHAFHKNGNSEISLCGQIVLEEIRDTNVQMLKGSNCPRCEKFIRRLSRIKPTSAGLKAVLDIHNQNASIEEAV